MPILNCKWTPKLFSNWSLISRNFLNTAVSPCRPIVIKPESDRFTQFVKMCLHSYSHSVGSIPYFDSSSDSFICRYIYYFIKGKAELLERFFLFFHILFVKGLPISQNLLFLLTNYSLIIFCDIYCFINGQ